MWSFLGGYIIHLTDHHIYWPFTIGCLIIAPLRVFIQRKKEGRFTKIKRNIKIWGLAERVGTSSPLGDVLIWEEIVNQNFLYYFLGNSFHHLSQKKQPPPFQPKKTSFPNRHISKPTKKSVLHPKKKQTPIAEPRSLTKPRDSPKTAAVKSNGTLLLPNLRVAGWTTPPMPTLNLRNKTLIRLKVNGWQ